MIERRQLHGLTLYHTVSAGARGLVGSAEGPQAGDSADVADAMSTPRPRVRALSA